MMLPAINDLCRATGKGGKPLLPVAPSIIKERINFSPSRPRLGDDAPSRESENVQKPE
jgi:hypothetical protein